MTDFAPIIAELEREIDQRRETFPRLVAKGSMDQADADRQLALFQAIRDDAIRFREAERAGVNPIGLPCAHRFTWQHRRAALLRERQYRARLYPRWIEQGKLDQDEAQQRTLQLEAMLDCYERGLDWLPDPPGAPPAEAQAQSLEMMAQRWHRRGEADALDRTIAALALYDRDRAEKLHARLRPANQAEIDLTPASKQT